MDFLLRLCLSTRAGVWVNMVKLLLTLCHNIHMFYLCTLSGIRISMVEECFVSFRILSTRARIRLNIVRECLLMCRILPTWTGIRLNIAKEYFFLCPILFTRAGVWVHMVR